MEESKVCKSCLNPVRETYYFCPYCGKKLKNPPLSTSFLHQAGVYIFAVLLPPLGLVPAIRYLNQPDNKSKIVGLVALLLTGFSFLAGIYYGIIFLQSYEKFLTSQGLEIGLGF